LTVGTFSSDEKYFHDDYLFARNEAIKTMMMASFVAATRIRREYCRLF